jgi:hypothetical protein
MLYGLADMKRIDQPSLTEPGAAEELEKAFKKGQANIER